MKHQLQIHAPEAAGPTLLKKGTASPWYALKTLSRNILVTVGLLILVQDLYLVALTSRMEEDCEISESDAGQLHLSESSNNRRQVKSLPSKVTIEPHPQVAPTPRISNTRRSRNTKPNKQAYLNLLGQLNDSAVLSKLQDVPYNHRRIDKLRNDIFKETHIKQYLFASKDNTPLGSPLQFFEGRNRSVHYAVPELHNMLPSPQNKKLRWPKSPLHSCSVVGNGGILLDSGCGPNVDSAKVVLRSNLPPLTLEGSAEGAMAPPVAVDYYKDVGKKTSFVTFNPSGFTEYLGGLTSERLLVNFKTYMDQFGHAIAWTHMFHYESKARPALQVIKLSQALGFKSTIVSSHAKFLQGVNDFWSRRGLTGQRATSGLVLTALSLALCKETHLYGYWPFPVDYEGREVPYHYYTYDAEHKQNNTFHKLPEEFKILQNLHRTGVIKLHVGKCDKKH
ncbi:alpha-N-acetylneuraminide alpha-2,8-sialyltransferase-like [Branchiostoma lanceolatum]|uniref:alpha-N-acetylneuraminide alpha-2,8-sialyltransferase-like n=1 Tax=Branchiostoma lanceolatum TaxID=7740 RepID=UPI0034541996